MNALLNVTTKLLAYTDLPASSNPRKALVQWTSDVSGVSVVDPRSYPVTLDPGETVTLFDGLRTTTIDGTTTFAITLSNLDPSRYRFTWTSGTTPGLRTGRSLTLSGIAVTVLANANSTATWSVPPLSASDFASVQVGDIVFLPGIGTGDAASEFNELNTGYWQVLSKASSTNITLMRLAGEDFLAYSETVTPTTNTAIRAFTSTGVQPGDTADVISGFALASRKAFQVLAVTDTFFEVISTNPIALETGILPTAAGLVFYTDTQSFLYIEADQEIVVRVNGDTGNFQRVVPVGAGDPTKVGVYQKRGPTYALSLYNRSPFTANVLIVQAE